MTERTYGVDPMLVTIVFTKKGPLDIVNVTFKPWISESVSAVLTLTEIDDLVSQLRAAQSAFDEDEHDIDDRGNPAA